MWWRSSQRNKGNIFIPTIYNYTVRANGTNGIPLADLAMTSDELTTRTMAIVTPLFFHEFP